MTSTVIEDGGVWVMDRREVFALSFNMSAWLDPSDVCVAGTSELRRISDGVNYTTGLSGLQTVNGQTLSQTVTTLEAGERYWLIMPFTSAGRTFAPRKLIECPEV